MSLEEDSIYRELSKERKRMQEEGLAPDFITTPAWQILKSKYLTPEETNLKQFYLRIANAAAKHTEGLPGGPELWSHKFFSAMWKGWLSPSTPVLTNLGTNRGCPVSCSGSYIGDSIYDFFDNRLESALLSKHGFGTSGYLGDIRPRGTPISSGGVADGVVPVLKGHIQMARDVSQGQSRRGAWAGYIPIDHDDFWEVCDFITSNPDDCNIGWNVTQGFIDRLNNGDKDAVARYQRSLKVKMISGKGYYCFIDKMNALSPVMYKDLGLLVKSSNLCTEITLHSDEDHTFSCILSSVNLSKFDEWKDTDLIKVGIVFLDCVAEEFIQKGRGIKGLEKVVRFTEKSRALGLGALGFHTYLQSHSIPFESFEAHSFNSQIFKKIHDEAQQASRELAEHLGEPEWCRGYGMRNTHLIAVAPNLSSALICGSVSQGIEPVYKNVYTQDTPAGEINRVNPVLLRLIEEKGLDEEEVIQELIKANGSVQEVDWLDDHEKLVFKTAFEIDQHTIIRLAAARQQFIDQAQSINLFFPSDEKEEVISSVHQEAFNNPWIKSLYYIRSEAGVKGSTGACIACEG